MRAKGTWAFPLSLAALHHRFIHLFGGCCLRRLPRRFIDIHHTDLRLALGPVMATIWGVPKSRGQLQIFAGNGIRSAWPFRKNPRASFS